MSQGREKTHQVFESEEIKGEETLKLKRNNSSYLCCENSNIKIYRGIFICQNCDVVFGPITHFEPMAASRSKLESLFF